MNHRHKVLPTRNTTMKPTAACAFLLASFLLASTASAASVWNGGGADDNWTTTANWGASGSDGIPSTDGTAEVQFDGSTRLTPTVDTHDPWAVGSIVFNSTADAFTIGGLEISLQGSGQLMRNNSSATQTFNNDLQIDGAGWNTLTAASGDIVLNGAMDVQRSFAVRGGRVFTINGLISGAAGQAVNRTDGGTLRLTNPGNTFSGNPSVSHGVLEIASIANSGVACAIGTGDAIALGQGNWGPSDTGTLRYTGPDAATDRAIEMTSNANTQASHTLPFSGRPTIAISDPSTTLTFNGDFRYSGSSVLGQWRLRGEGIGVINGDITTDGARLEKNGPGTWILNGDSNHGGITEVLDGTLLLNGTHTGGDAYSVADGATLGGDGHIPADVALADGATLAPGSSVGTLELAADLALDPLAMLEFELNGGDTTVGGGVNDLITVAGDLTLDGTLGVSETVAGSFATAAYQDTWTLIEYAGTLTDNGLVLGSMPGGVGSAGFHIAAGNGAVVLTRVPEPSSLLLVLLGATAMLFGRRRSRWR
jgi:fibronectin-binding autotransporter adhesin